MHSMKRYFLLLLLFSPGLFITNGYAVDIALPEMGDSAGALISPREEYDIGQAFFWRLQQNTELVEDPEVNSYIQSLGYKLASNSDEPGLNYTFFMVPDQSVNAFAAPGGFIGVNAGLLLTAESEDELASVMAHEIAHITQRHILRSFERYKRMTIPRTAAMIAAALLGAADPRAGSAAILAVQAGDIQSQIDYTRAHESEADNLGMQTLVQAGFDPNAMPSFFEKLQQASRYYGGDSVPEFLRTHPVTLSRIADARGRAVKYQKQQQLSDGLQFYLMKEKLRVMTTDDSSKLLNHYEQVLSLDNDKNKDPARYGYALALLKSGQHTRARSTLQPLLEKDHDRLAYQLALADIEMAVGRVSTALAIYEEFQRLYPDDQALSMNHVHALLRNGRPQEAANLLQTQLDLGENSRDVYKLMAQAKGDMGQKSQAHTWLAEYYYRSGLLKAAADQLRLAADAAGNDEYQRAKIASRLREVENALAQMEQQ
ncbi:M48 family metalloprotease [Methylophaga sp.]|uniref:M48 family metalloprotease n=1 Tax=Methylophaga sp. TaxID=2024840 RepID=UPI003F6A1691